MKDYPNGTQVALLTGHKGVDLHAASAWAVMNDRLAGGDSLQALYRCEWHTFWGDPDGWNVDRLLATGRFYNPNKHYFCVFTTQKEVDSWFGETDSAAELSLSWPERVVTTDLADFSGDGGAARGRLLGGSLPPDCAAFDLVSFVRGQTGPVLSGVMWRLVIRGDNSTARRIGEELAVARERKRGLLVNPHMESWFAVTV